MATAASCGTCSRPLSTAAGHSPLHEHTAEACGVDWNLVRGLLRLVLVGPHGQGKPSARLARRSPSTLVCLRGQGHPRTGAAAQCRATTPSACGSRAEPSAQLTCVAGEQEVLSVDWNKYDEHCFATGAVDKTVRLWDLRAPQQPVQVLAAHTFAVRRVRFCPHSAAQLLSASYDMSVCLWDVVTATHRPLQQYNHHSEFVIGLEWSLFQE